MENFQGKKLLQSAVKNLPAQATKSTGTLNRVFFWKIDFSLGEMSKKARDTWLLKLLKKVTDPIGQSGKGVENLAGEIPAVGNGQHRVEIRARGDQV